MALNSTSTTAEVLAQYIDNSDWDGNPAKAALALQAVRILMAKRPENMADGDGQSMNYASLATEKKDLEAFVRSTSTTAVTGRRSFTRGVML